MRFLLDENVEYRVAAYLRGRGHDVAAVAYDYPHALADREVLRIANAEGRILLTNDRDFGELIFRQALPHSGVLYFRLPLDSTVEEKIARLQRVLDEHHRELDQFIVITPRQIRVRHSPAGEPANPQRPSTTERPVAEEGETGRR